jgi:hypothetical protein
MRARLDCQVAGILGGGSVSKISRREKQFRAKAQRRRVEAEQKIYRLQLCAFAGSARPPFPAAHNSHAGLAGA